MKEIKSILGIEVKEVIYQDLYERDRIDPATHERYPSYYYDVEFMDRRGGYHHYKSCFDKGIVTFTDGTEIDFDRLDPRCVVS